MKHKYWKASARSSGCVAWHSLILKVFLLQICVCDLFTGLPGSCWVTKLLKCPPKGLGSWEWPRAVSPHIVTHFQLGLAIPRSLTEVKLLRNWEKGEQSHLPVFYSNLEWQHWVFWATSPGELGSVQGWKLCSANEYVGELHIERNSIYFVQGRIPLHSEQIYYKSVLP